MADDIRLTIDGREVHAPKGSTVLDAAASLGLAIPTLCYAEGHKPITSCFACLVQVDGRDHFSPACGTEALDGMRVTSQAPDVLAARRASLELLLSEHHGDCEAPCTLVCPAGLDIPTMIEHIEAGRPAQAAASAREQILFNSVLGRICPAFCERACRRAELDQPVSIAALQRRAGDEGVARKVASPPAAPSGKRVAIIGAGPAGLTAAYYLMRRGHACTLFDAEASPGGAWRSGVPEFRLPRAALDGEIDVLRQMGAEFRMGVRLGETLSLDDVRRQADAVLLATGAPVVLPLDCPGADLARSGIGFLREANAGRRPAVGSAVVVIGAGSPGADEARVALRLGAKRVVLLRPGEKGSPDSIGTGVKGPGPFFSKSQARIAAAEEEGAQVLHGAPVHRIESIPAGRCLVMAEHDGRPVSFEADTVLAAGERTAEVALFERLGLAVAKHGLAADAKTHATSVPGVFAAGECVRGPDYGVRAVASGRAAAACIDQFLRGATIAGEPKRVNSRMGHLTAEELADIRSTADPAMRRPTARADARRRRGTFDEVDPALGDEDVTAESRRCLQCSCLAKEECRLRDLATECGASPGRFKGPHRKFARDLSHPKVLFESHKCILCGLCLRAAAQAGEKLGLAFAGRGFSTVVAVPFEEPLAKGLTVAAEACVEACPTGALAWKRRCGEWPEGKGAGP